MNLYTVNAPWLFSLLWCAGVPSVTSDNSHALSQVPSPLWIMVSWGIIGGQTVPGGVQREPWHRVGGRLRARDSVRSQGWGAVPEAAFRGLWGLHEGAGGWEEPGPAQVRNIT